MRDENGSYEYDTCPVCDGSGKDCGSCDGRCNRCEGHGEVKRYLAYDEDE